jgi:uncharacterized membrane protein
MSVILLLKMSLSFTFIRDLQKYVRKCDASNAYFHYTYYVMQVMHIFIILTSVADPGCLSWIRIFSNPDPHQRI